MNARARLKQSQQQQQQNMHTHSSSSSGRSKAVQLSKDIPGLVCAACWQFASVPLFLSRLSSDLQWQQRVTIDPLLEAAKSEEACTTT